MCDIVFLIIWFGVIFKLVVIINRFFFYKV